MMRKLVAGAAVGIGLLALAPAVYAAIYSPTQAELAALEYVDFIDNEAADNAMLYTPIPVGDDAVEIPFDVDYDINDALYRVAGENLDFSADLTGLDAFGITFSNPVHPEGLGISAQIFVRTDEDNVFVSTSATPLSTTYPTTIWLPVSSITSAGGDPASVSSFGVEFFADEFSSVLTGYSVTASTSEPPPEVEDHVLYSWETADNPATPDVNEALEGWGPGVHYATEPTEHSVSTDWASEGTHSMKAVRTYNSNGFSWGSQMNLDANANAGGAAVGDYNEDGAVDAADYTVWRDNLGTSYELPNRDPENTGNVSIADFNSWRSNFGATGGGPDPAVMAQIGDLVEQLTDPNAYSIAFDVHIDDQYPADNPSWLHFDVAISLDNGDPDNGAWFQPPEAAIDYAALSGLDSGEPVTATCEFLLSQFEDQNHPGDFLLDGINELTQYLGFHISTNSGWTEPGTEFTFYIDNFRIRNLVPAGAGSLGAAAVPEPSAVVLALLAGLGLIGLGRR